MMFLLKKDDIIEITTKEIGEGDKKRVSINYLDFPKDVNANEKILVNDGKLILKVLITNKKDLVQGKSSPGGVFRVSQRS